MNKTLDMISKFCCFILSVVLFFVLFFYLLLNTSTKVINRDNIITIVSNLDIATIIDKENLNKIYENEKLTEFDKNITYELINSKEFKGLLGKYFGNVIELVLYDKQNDKVTKEEVVNIINDTIDYTANKYSIIVTYYEKQLMIDSLEEEINTIVDEFSNEEKVMNELTQEDINLIRFFFGKGAQTILLIVITVILILIIIFRWSFYRFAIWTGITTVMSGVFFISSANVLCSLFKNQMLQTITIGILEKNVFSIMTKSGLITIIIGIIQIIYYYILKKGNENVNV